MKRWLFYWTSCGILLSFAGALPYDGWQRQAYMPLGNPFWGLLYGGNDFFPAGGSVINDAISRELTVMHAPLEAPETPAFSNSVSRELTVMHAPLEAPETPAFSNSVSRELTLINSPAAASPETPAFTNAVSRDFTLYHVPVDTPGEIVPPTDSVTRTYTLLNPCPDFDENGIVDDGDLLRLLFVFGAQGLGILEDVNFDGSVDDIDLLIVLFLFGSPCIP